MAEETKMVEALRVVPIVARPDLLTVTTIKKRYVEQLPEVGAEVFDRLEVVGLWRLHGGVAGHQGWALGQVNLNAWVDFLTNGNVAQAGSL